MATEFGEVISRIVPSSEREVSPPVSRLAKPVDLSVVLGHEGLFRFYGIPLDILKPSPKSGVTRLETRDGDLEIDWDKRVIVPPLKYYFSQR